VLATTKTTIRTQKNTTIKNRKDKTQTKTIKNIPKKTAEWLQDVSDVLAKTHKAKKTK